MAMARTKGRTDPERDLDMIRMAAKYGCTETAKRFNVAVSTVARIAKVYSGYAEAILAERKGV